MGEQTMALASYAKQSEDKDLFNLAVRIRARAIRRCGELLRQIQPKPGARSDLGPAPTRGSNARKAGLSKRQQRNTARVASIPEQSFESQVESDNPPSVDDLARQGTKARPATDLKGLDPEEFRVSTYAQGRLKELVLYIENVDPAVVVRGAFEREYARMLTHIEKIQSWLKEIEKEISQC